MNSLQFIRSLQEMFPNIRVVERIGHMNERKPEMAYSTKQALSNDDPTPCWYLEVFSKKEGVELCTHRQATVLPEGKVDLTDDEKDNIARRMLIDIAMGGIIQAHVSLRELTKPLNN